jgi:N-acetylglutamate synthase-like GNAT family acetyltransferase
LFRYPVHVRDATPDDADALLEVWVGFTTRPSADRDSAPSPRAEAACAAARVAADPDQRMLVAVLDDKVVGAAHLIRAPLSPVHSEQAVHMSHLNVLDDYRKRGVGRALIEAAVSWAEEKASTHVFAAASVNSRDANRYMARLGFGQVAVVRGATVSALRSKMPVEPPAAARVGSRNHRGVGQVLAKRRSQRRAQINSQ